MEGWVMVKRESGLAGTWRVYLGLSRSVWVPST